VDVLPNILGQQLGSRHGHAFRDAATDTRSTGPERGP